MSALTDSGWVITASWPIATERKGRPRAHESAALATSVHLICRPRPEDASVGDWAAVLRELPADVEVGLGCVDVRFPEIDTPDAIVGRVGKALSHVAAGRLTLNPDCGFAPGKDHEIPLEEAYAKLKSLGEAARQLRTAHG